MNGTENMTCEQIKLAICDKLSESGLAYWNGMDAGTQNEMVVEAQTEGIAKAVATVEELAY